MSRPNPYKLLSADRRFRLCDRSDSAKVRGSRGPSDAGGLHSKIQVLLYLVASQIKIKLTYRACDNGEGSSGVEGGKLVSPRRRD